MKKWTTGIWFRPLTMIILISFFFLYGVNLTLLTGVARMSSAYAQDMDDLLDEDDDDLFDEETDDEKPAVTKKSAPAKEDDEDDEDDEDIDNEDIDDEDDEDIDEDDEDVEQEAVKAERPKLPKPVLGTTVNGPKSIAPVVFGATDRSKRRAVEVDMLTKAWFKSNKDFTWQSVNKALGDPTVIDEDAVGKKAVAAVDAGIADYKNGDYEDAVDALEEAIEELGPVLTNDKYRSKLEEALMYMAASFVQDDDEDEAIQVFSRLLQNNPKATIDDKPFSKDVLEIFEETQDELEDADTSSVAVTSKPEKASVFVDGNFRGLTPITIDNLAVGTHYFKVEKSAHKSFQMQLRLFKGVEKKLPVTLSQVNKYYDFQGELRNIQSKYQHRYMWGAVQELSDSLGSEYMYFCRVSEASNVVTLEAYYYDTDEEIYKTDSYDINLAKEDLETGVLTFLQVMFSNYIEEEDTYVPPEQAQEPAAVVAGGTAFYQTWWFWTIIGVAVVGGVGAGLYFGGVFDSGDGGNGQDFEYPNSINVNF